MGAEPDDSPRVFAGVDEAGLGPILGPLTVGYSVFRAPRAGANLWKSLRIAVSDDPSKDKTRFVVADSKVVFKRSPRCEKRLETTVLGFLSLLREGRDPPSDVADVLWRTPAELAPSAAALDEAPWFREYRRALPMHQEAGRLELSVERLWRAMRNASVTLLDAGVSVLPAGDLNRSFEQTDNKSLTHWETSLRVFRYLWERFADQDLRLVVDRHGGRYHYGPLLGRAFPEAEVVQLRERPSHAEYRVRERSGRRRMRISFAERAERRSFAAALGSCIAKYAREASMEAFNTWFSERQPDLKPTAGYTTDGRRWLADAAALIEQEGLDRRILVRER